MEVIQSIVKNTWAMITIIVLIFFSVMSIFFIVERALVFRYSKINVRSLMAKLKSMIKKGGNISPDGVRQAIVLCAETPGPVATVLKEVLKRVNHTGKEMEEAMERAALLETDKLEKNLSFLGSIGSSAPFIGLLGTVIGVYESFAQMKDGGGGLQTVSAGIGTALIATVIGLFVAIPAVIGYNLLINRVNKFGTEMKVAASDLMELAAGKEVVEAEEHDD